MRIGRFSHQGEGCAEQELIDRLRSLGKAEMRNDSVSAFAAAGADKANESAKKLQKTLGSFDELNVMADNSDSGSGSGAGSGSGSGGG